MDFTREPIIETVISARDGHRIVLRSSKQPGQEEFFVDALEVVSFHGTCFYRCLERPRAFMLPAVDYEVLEVREPRLPLKAASKEPVQREGWYERREKALPQQPPREPRTPVEKREEVVPLPVEEGVEEGEAAPRPADRRRDRRRNVRKRGKGTVRPGENGGDEAGGRPPPEPPPEVELVQPGAAVQKRAEPRGKGVAEEAEDTSQQLSTLMTSVLPPPTTLIRDELAKMRNSELYKDAFYLQDEERVTAGEQGSVAPRFGDDSQSRVVEDDDDFIPSSTLRFDDDDDAVQSNAYMAKPTAGKQTAPGRDDTGALKR